MVEVRAFFQAFGAGMFPHIVNRDLVPKEGKGKTVLFMVGVIIVLIVFLFLH